MFVWDESKRLQNMRKHGVDFAEIEQFEFETALEADVTLAEYRETRTQALGFAGAKLLVVIYTMRGSNFRIISMRRASRKEKDIYVEYISG